MPGPTRSCEVDGGLALPLGREGRGCLRPEDRHALARPCEGRAPASRPRRPFVTSDGPPESERTPKAPAARRSLPEDADGIPCQARRPCPGPGFRIEFTDVSWRSSSSSPACPQTPLRAAAAAEGALMTGWRARNADRIHGHRTERCAGWIRLWCPCPARRSCPDKLQLRARTSHTSAM